MDAVTLNSGKLKLGSQGDPVVEVRTALHAVGYTENYSVTKPWVFDQWMHAAVCDVQKKAGLKVDGIVGPKTWAKLAPATVPMSPPVVQPAQPGTGADVPAVLTHAEPVPTSTVLMLAGGLAILGYYFYSKQGRAMAGFGGKKEHDDSGDEYEDADVDDEPKGYMPEAVREQATKNIRRDRQIREREHRDVVKGEIRRRLTDLKDQLDSGEITPSDYKIRAAQIEAAYVRGGRGKPGALPTYSTTKLTSGQRFIPGTIRKPGRRSVATVETVSRELKRMAQRAPDAGRVERRMTTHEEEMWMQRDREAAARTGRSGPSGAPAKVSVSSKLYRGDERYREEAQDKAREKADREKRRVTIVDENGSTLYDYLPPVHRYGDMGDALSEKMILDVKAEARDRNCPKAIRQLTRVQGLIRTAREERLFDETAKVVEMNCGKEWKAERESRAEIHRELPRGVVDITPGRLQSIARANRKQKLRDMKKAERKRAEQGMKPDTRPIPPEDPMPRGGVQVDPSSMWEAPARVHKRVGRPKAKSADPKPILLRPRDKSNLPANIYLSPRAYKARMVRLKK